MATERANDLRAFREFIDERFASGNASLTLDEALSLWESETSTEAEREATVQAIREGLADVEAGRVRPAREAVAEIRRKHGLPPLP